MKRLLIVSLISLQYYSSNAQHSYTDSLRAVLATSVNPTERFSLVNNILEYGYINGEGDPDSSYCIDLIRIARQINSDSLLAIAYNQVGNYFLRVRGEFSSAIEYFFKGVPFAEAAHDKRRLSSLYIDIGAVYASLNNGEEEIKYILKAIANLPDKSSPS